MVPDFGTGPFEASPLVGILGFNGSCSAFTRKDVEPRGLCCLCFFGSGGGAGAEML
jgi:hypothetical protein